LSEKGAVGDICLRFFDRSGRQVVTELNDRVISMDLDQLRSVRRVVGVAGGRRKLAAIRGALAGKLVTVLITDLVCAQQLVTETAAGEGVGGSDARASRRAVRTQ
jgi:DNA-binding transcriptional regulator LsrR (DeoR family)